MSVWRERVPCIQRRGVLGQQVQSRSRSDTDSDEEAERDRFGSKKVIQGNDDLLSLFVGPKSKLFYIGLRV